MKLLRPLVCLCLLAFSCLSLLAEDETVGWEIRAQNPMGELEYDPNTGVATATKGVILTYQDVAITAEKITANEQTGEALAEGNVTIKTADNLWRGDRFIYNFKNKTIRSGTFKSGRTPYFFTGDQLTGDKSNNVYTATNVVITTDNYAQPSYRIRTRQFTLVPGDYFMAEHATLFIGDVPVFYWPKLKRSLKPHTVTTHLVPGFRSSWGPFLLTSVDLPGPEWFDPTIRFDMRAKRGFAGGPLIDLDLKEKGKGVIDYYYAHDEDPGVDFSGRNLPTNRQRVNFLYRTDFDTNFTFKTAIRYQQDPLIVRDFFESEYRQNVQPSSYANLNKFWDNWSLDFLAQPQVNDFFETVERLPDVRLTGLRQQLGETPFYYDSESSAGYFQRRFASTNLMQDFAAFRGDTYHQITLPHTFFGWLNVTPRVGGRLTYYTDASGPGGFTDEETRGVFNTGAEVSFKTSRIWKNAENKFFDVHGLRHIFQPSVNYVFVPGPNVEPPDLPQFDYELPSFRLLPIDFPDYNRIDSIDSQNVFRFMLRNKLQTKRSEGVENFVNWALYTDLRLDPRTGQNRFADFYSDLDFRPRSWLTLNSETRFNIHGDGWREANHRLIIAPNNVWSVMFGHRYLAEDPSFGPPPTGDNLFYDRFFYRVNENWAFSMAHFFQARDGRMEEQYYTVYRDLRSWTAALSLRLRDDRSGSDDFTIALTFSLKAFPRFGIGQDRDTPGTLFGG